MDYWRSPGVKEMKALQDLPTPAPQDLGFHHLKALQVTVQIEQRQDFVVKLKEQYCDRQLNDHNDRHKNIIDTFENQYIIMGHAS